MCCCGLRRALSNTENKEPPVRIGRRYHQRLSALRTSNVLFKFKDALPVALQADNGPAGFLCLIKKLLGKGSDLGVRQSLRGPVGIFAVSHHHAALASSGAHHRQRPCIPTFRGRRSSYRTPRTDVDRSSDECPPACPRRYRSEEASALWLGTACRLYGSRTLCRQRYQPPARAIS